MFGLEWDVTKAIWKETPFQFESANRSCHSESGQGGTNVYSSHSTPDRRRRYSSLTHKLHQPELNVYNLYILCDIGHTTPIKHQNMFLYFW